MATKIGIVGLGLIGGSLAKALKANTSHWVVGLDADPQVTAKALLQGAIDQVAREGELKGLDLVFLALYPGAAVEYAQKHLSAMDRGSILVDLCGIKGYVCQQLGPLCRSYGVHYIGGHPMAGREFSGFDYAQAELFQGGSMLLVPQEDTPEKTLTQVETLCRQVGFGQVVRTTAEKHDQIIAFTSQLAHVVSSAYIKSRCAQEQMGYSAGSYKDLTRVAKLNETMWTELFLKNSGPLVDEIDQIITHLTEYRDAIQNQDAPTLQALLKDGRERKERLG